MTAFLLAIAIGQVVEFNDSMGYSEVRGTAAQQILFYELWREHACPDWRTVNREWWDREYLRIKLDARFRNRILFHGNANTRRQVLRTAIVYGYTLKFKVIVHPFGHTWIIYNSHYHVIATVVALLGIIWYLWRRSHNRCVKTPNPA